ncbi:MAG: VCBS repeat-containing protein [Lachnospiraceae bacterium]|nr:VCBS repeat-containing protein [Lachnospiraceae bacterium]
MALFFADQEGKIVYRIEDLETNFRNQGELEQFTDSVAAISFRELNGDGAMDIVLVTAFANETEGYAGSSLKVGDVLFQDKEGKGFYRDYRITDKVNRFGMNKSADLIAAFVGEGYSTEFMYTATTLDELLENGLVIITEQSYPRNFEKLGRLQVIPGTYAMADYEFLMIYLVNEEGYIISSLEPMENYDNLYALRGISCQDIDGDGLRDIVVRGRYSYEGEGHQLVVEADYSVYYQRTGGFVQDAEIKKSYRCSEEETMDEVVAACRAYWGWKQEE